MPGRKPYAMSIRLFSYKLTHDVGFAPNPFHGVCTLATCKAQMRRSKLVGDWIAGFTSKALNGDPVGSERLVYLMQVAEKLPLGDYYADRRFAKKVPPARSQDSVRLVGDNIYAKRNGRLVQVPNSSHGPSDVTTDISGENVLVATTFAYFGSAPLSIPRVVRPSLLRGQAGHGVRTKDENLAQRFVNFVLSKGLGVHACPTSWQDGDVGWRSTSECSRRPC